MEVMQLLKMFERPQISNLYLYPKMLKNIRVSETPWGSAGATGRFTEAPAASFQGSCPLKASAA